MKTIKIRPIEETPVSKRIRLTDQLNQLAKKSNELKLELHKLKVTESLEINKKFIGNCYKVIENRCRTYVRCFYIYGIDDQGNFESLELSYYTDKDTYYEITYQHLFDPSEVDCLELKWKCISKAKFDSHLNKVMELIKSKTNV